MPLKHFTDSLPPEHIIQVDYEAQDLPEAVRKYKPKIFKDGGSYCCCYGPDPQIGILGWGYSPDEALKSWNRAYLKEGIKFFTNGNDGKS